MYLAFPFGWHHDTLQNDIQHNVTEHNDAQHNNNYNTQYNDIQSLCQKSLYWVSFMLRVVIKSIMLSVIMQNVKVPFS
jgi:hypothetical protein